MSAIWHDHGKTSWLGSAPSYSFCDLPEIHVEAPAAYQAAMADIRAREILYGSQWFRDNAELAHAFWEKKKPWWL